MDKITFKALQEEDIDSIVEAFKKLGWDKSLAQYQQYLVEQKSHLRNIWVAWNGKEFLGYVTLKWQSDYMPFKQKNIPEINDLNVLPDYRSQGIGSKLLDLAEEEANKKSEVVGLGVGLYADYGNAQKMYVKRGYIPDGHGITYKNKALSWNEKVLVDDDLVLWFVKRWGPFH